MMIVFNICLYVHLLLFYLLVLSSTFLLTLFFQSVFPSSQPFTSHPPSLSLPTPQIPPPSLPSLPTHKQVHFPSCPSLFPFSPFWHPSPPSVSPFPSLPLQYTNRFTSLPISSLPSSPLQRTQVTLAHIVTCNTSTYRWEHHIGRGQQQPKIQKSSQISQKQPKKATKTIYNSQLTAESN